ncbi:hypothetical protein RB195_015156 [Necator americanus]|uniref:Uncharacterized protein n=1 Tax=Necator americanus TaxID=51031 RepID=A0ABR1E3S6_NECAM
MKHKAITHISSFICVTVTNYDWFISVFYEELSKGLFSTNGKRFETPFSYPASITSSLSARFLNYDSIVIISLLSAKGKPSLTIVIDVTQALPCTFTAPKMWKHWFRCIGVVVRSLSWSL